jgi:YggT family protein
LAFRPVKAAGQPAIGVALVDAAKLDDLSVQEVLMDVLAFFFMKLIDLYIWVIIISAILSWLIAFNVVNSSNRFVMTVADTLWRLTDPALRPIRKMLPDLGGVDISPVLLIILLLTIEHYLGRLVQPQIVAP